MSARHAVIIVAGALAHGNGSADRARTAIERLPRQDVEATLSGKADAPSIARTYSSSANSLLGSTRVWSSIIIWMFPFGMTKAFETSKVLDVGTFRRSTVTVVGNATLPP